MHTVQQPYELLARFDTSGELSGIHIQFRYITFAEDGSVLGEVVGPAEPLGSAAAATFPLSAVTQRLQAVPAAP